MANIVNKKLKSLDIKYGNDNQSIGKDMIEDYLDLPLRSYKDMYSTFDFYNTEMKILVELKSRRCDSKKYKTQLIGKNKMDSAKKRIKEGFKVYFFWLLEDGLWVYEVCPNHEFETTFLGNYARNDKAKELILIPNLVLNKVIPKEQQIINNNDIKHEPFVMTWN